MNPRSRGYERTANTSSSDRDEVQRILILCEDPEFAGEMSSELQDAGMEGDWESDPAAAVRRMEREEIAAIVVDVGGHFDAYAWMRPVRERLDAAGSRVPAIAVSSGGSALHTSPYRAVASGFDVHLLLGRRGALREHLERFLGRVHAAVR